MEEWIKKSEVLDILRSLPFDIVVDYVYELKGIYMDTDTDAVNKAIDECLTLLAKCYVIADVEIEDKRSFEEMTNNLKHLAYMTGGSYAWDKVKEIGRGIVDGKERSKE